MMDQLMCWICYIMAERTIANVESWKYEFIQGHTFNTCPECQEEEPEDD